MSFSTRYVPPHSCGALLAPFQPFSNADTISTAPSAAHPPLLTHRCSPTTSLHSLRVSSPPLVCAAHLPHFCTVRHLPLFCTVPWSRSNCCERSLRHLFRHSPTLTPSPPKSPPLRLLLTHRTSLSARVQPATGVLLTCLTFAPSVGLVPIIVVRHRLNDPSAISSAILKRRPLMSPPFSTIVVKELFEGKNKSF